ncbi:GWxTD domain-containing protein [Fodinibius sp.]|uniref:GWxTD domain-containing protein n=1 Tax=Fodinibius sp. TaxID=1872440 RepID=UPI002ACDDA9E|nr:GWxTD domain-containing protein [Fodinibius sp.]MDZ7657810.1 GWxTD domain-containing protein [Fodinibius sp.]
MIKPLRIFLLFLTFAGSIFLFSCSSSKIDVTQQGSDYTYKVGHPELRINAFGFIDQEQGPTLEITAEVIKGSLVYSQQNDSLSANIAIDIQIVDLDNGENIIESERITKTVSSSNEQITSSRETITINYSQQVSPSNYQISVTVTDLNSKRKLTQTTETFIPETDEGEFTISTIQMYGKEDDTDWAPITGYDVQSSVDSLRFIFQVISPQTERPMTIDSRLVEFRSDTGLPRSMTRNNYSPSSIEYKGIDYDRETVIQSTRRVLSDYSSVFVEYKFANQNRGNYRFEVTTKKEGDEEDQFNGRAFGVKSPNFPAVQNLNELARPLVYLMDSKQYESLMEISDKDSLKRVIDRFWLKNIGNKQKTRRVIELYYTRVEQANKMYSNFKEGWKTDRGMIYVMFGNPFYTRDRLRALTWYYSYNLEDPEYRFRFVQPQLNNKFFPFDHYLLQRQSYYHSRRYIQRDLWLSGSILQRRI